MMTFEKLYDFLFAKEKDELLVYYEHGKRISLSTAEVKRRTGVMAEYIGISMKDVPKGAWIALKCTNSGNWLIAFFAILKSGYRALLLDGNTPQVQLASFVKCAEVQCIVTDSIQPCDAGISVLGIKEFDYGKDTPYSTHEYEWSDRLAYVTSGTASEARIYTYTAEAVMLEQQELAAVWRKIDEKHNHTHNDCMVQILPLRHIFGLVTFLCGIAFGYTAVFPENIGIIELIRVIREERPWIMPAVPAIWKGIITIVKVKCAGSCKSRDFESVFGGSLTCGICAGAKPERNLVAEVLGAGIKLYGGWGMTEVGTAAVGELTLGNIDSGYVGELLEWYEAVLIGDDGRVLKSGTGELAVKGASLHYSMITSEGEIPRSGEYFKTGDIFTYKDRKCCFIGRKKSVIISDSGENAYPEEIEEAIADITAGFSQSCVFDYRGTAALYVTATQLKGQEELLVAALREKNRSLSVKNKISAVFVSCEPAEVTSKGELSRFMILDHIKTSRNIKKYIIMKGMLSDADDD